MTPYKRTFLIAFAVFVVAIALSLSISSPKTSRIFLNQRRAVASIRNINLAEYDYAVRHPRTGFACALGDLTENGVDRVLASGTKSSYHFDVGCPQGFGATTAYTITAVPIEPKITGRYALCSDQSREIWYSESGSPSDCLATRKPIEREYE
jgi:hypothetical protein